MLLSCLKIYLHLLKRHGPGLQISYKFTLFRSLHLSQDLLRPLTRPHYSQTPGLVQHQFNAGSPRAWNLTLNRVTTLLRSSHLSQHHVTYFSHKFTLSRSWHFTRLTYVPQKFTLFTIPGSFTRFTHVLNITQVFTSASSPHVVNDKLDNLKIG